MHKDASGNHIHHHDNYALMAQAASERFCTFDQQRIIDTLGVRHDDQWLYVRFLNRDLRVSRSTGEVFDAGEPAGFNEVLAVLDLLCSSDHPVRQTGEWLSLEQIAATAGSSPTDSRMFDALASQFAHRPDELAQACEEMGGAPKKGGDVSYLLPILPDFYTWMQFWDADEEFPQSLRFLFDATTPDHFKYETLYYIMGTIIKRLADRVAELAG